MSTIVPDPIGFHLEDLNLTTVENFKIDEFNKLPVDVFYKILNEVFSYKRRDQLDALKNYKNLIRIKAFHDIRIYLGKIFQQKFGDRLTAPYFAVLLHTHVTSLFLLGASDKYSNMEKVIETCSQIKMMGWKQYTGKEKIVIPSYIDKLPQLCEVGFDWCSDHQESNLNNLVKIAKVTNLTHLAITAGPCSSKNYKAILGVAGRLTKLQQLSIDLEDGDYNSQEKDDLSPLSKLTNLTALEICSRLLRKKSLKKLICGNLPKLERLNLHGSGVKNDFKEAFPFLQNLHYLDFCGYKVLSIDGIEELTKLSSLAIRCRNLEDDALKNVSKLTNLERLNLHGCEKLTGVCLKFFTTLTKLRWLDTISSKIQKSDFNQLSSLNQLTELWFQLSPRDNSGKSLAEILFGNNSQSLEQVIDETKK